MGASLALRGKRVGVVDFDLWERSLDMYLGLESRIVYDLGDLLTKQAAPQDVAIRHEKIQSLYLIPGAYGLRKLPSVLEVERVLGAIKGELSLDYLIIDASHEALGLLAPLVDCHLILTKSDALSVRSAASVVDRIREVSMADALLILNEMRENDGAQLRDLIDRVGIPLGGLIPFDAELARWQARGVPPHKGTGTLFGAAAYNIAMRLSGAHVPLLEGLPINRNKWLGR
jgi:septum site-determining protein MinD